MTPKKTLEVVSEKVFKQELAAKRELDSAAEAVREARAMIEQLLLAACTNADQGKHLSNVLRRLLLALELAVEKYRKAQADFDSIA